MFHGCLLLHSERSSRRPHAQVPDAFRAFAFSDGRFGRRVLLCLYYCTSDVCRFLIQHGRESDAFFLTELSPLTRCCPATACVEEVVGDGYWKLTSNTRRTVFCFTVLFCLLSLHSRSRRTSSAASLAGQRRSALRKDTPATARNRERCAKITSFWNGMESPSYCLEDSSAGRLSPCNLWFDHPVLNWKIGTFETGTRGRQISERS